MAEKNTVIVAVDGSPQAEQAVNYYLEYVHNNAQHRVVLVHVIGLPETGHSRENSLYPARLAEMCQEEVAKAKQLEVKFKEILSDKGISDPVFKSEGSMNPGQAICHEATQDNAIMIVMGTRGMGKIRRTFMGSVSDFVVHHAHCPVLICRHPEQVHQHEQQAQ